MGRYFERAEEHIGEWLFGAAPAEVKQGLRPFRMPRFTRPLSDWLNLVIEKGFQIERLTEPRPSGATVTQCPHVQDAQVVAYFLHVRGRKAS